MISSKEIRLSLLFFFTVPVYCSGLGQPQDIYEHFLISGLVSLNIPSDSEIKRQKSLQVKKLKSQLSILKLEIQNLESENHLLQSKIDVKKKKIYSIQEETNYQIDTYLVKISDCHKQEIVQNISMQNEIEKYKSKARNVKKNTLNEVVRIEQKLERLQSELKLNQKRLKRYLLSQDEKKKLIEYYHETE